MAMQTLLTTLRACYGENQNINPIFIAALQDNLPSDLSAAQAKALAQRLVTTYKFAPSIAEIVAEWRQLRRDMQRHVYEAPSFTGHMSRAAVQLLREAKTRIRDGRTMEHRPVSPKVMQFVRQFFPEISENTVRRSQLEIMNCMSEQQKEAAADSPYRTCMAMKDNGMITLYMRKVI